jgi:hypothetical protein
MKYLALLLLLFATSLVQAQLLNDVIFQNLADGAILVRLETKSRLISIIKDKNPEFVYRIKTNQKAKNDRIVDAFKNFSFCSVYFFYDTSALEILNKNFDSVLMDFNYKIIKEIPKLEANYLIANFGATYENKDTVEYGTIKYLDRNSEGKLYDHDIKVLLSTDMEGGVDALTLYDPNFIELQGPFPYYVRTFERLPFIARSYARTVELLQYKIEKFLTN